MDMGVLLGFTNGAYRRLVVLVVMAASIVFTLPYVWLDGLHLNIWL